MKKINLKSSVGILFAIVAGLAAFFGEMDNQKKEKQIEDMERRISDLEKGAE